jgi:uncharacterized membrane protein YhfC
MDTFIRIVNVLLMLGLPLLVTAVLVRRYKAGWEVVFLGAGTFLLSQVAEIPFNQAILSPFVSQLLGDGESPAPLLLFAVSAGVFEESSRYLVFRLGMRMRRGWGQALAFGAGHGAMEALVLGGIALYALLQAIAYRDVELGAILPLEQLDLARTQLDLFWSLPWTTALLGAVERVFALTIHIALSAMVLQIFTRGNIRWLPAAIAWHSLVDGVAVYGVRLWNPYVVEGVIGSLALGSLGILYLLRPREELNPELRDVAAVSPSAVQPSSPAPAPTGHDRLDESRFSDGQ